MCSSQTWRPSRAISDPPKGVAVGMGVDEGVGVGVSVGITVGVDVRVGVSGIDVGVSVGSTAVVPQEERRILKATVIIALALIFITHLIHLKIVP